MSTKIPYRLINFAVHDAAANMAIDEAILEAHLQGRVPPTLRIYQFAPAAVSFGYAQQISTEVIEKIEKRNLAFVRRPTGGRAVLHLGDITYSFVCSTINSPIVDYALVSESIAAAYKKICQALILALDSLGLTVTLGSNKNRYQDKQDCFLATTSADLQYNGKKIAGSAQLRRRHAVLQHGSIILNQPQYMLPELLRADGAAISDKNYLHHANLYELLDAHLSVTDLQRRLKSAFEQVFENQFLPMSLTKLEEELAVSYIGKYEIEALLTTLK